MKSEKELLEYIGRRIKTLSEEIDITKSRLQKEKRRAVIQEYYELLKYYKS
jgi:hypothetical protein